MSAQGRSAMAGAMVGDAHRDWLLWAIECAEMFGRRWRALPGGRPQWSAEPNATTCELPPRPASAKVAREFAMHTVGVWGFSPLADSVGLVVSELVTNALRHAPIAPPHRAGQPWWIQLSLAAYGPCVMCAVTDPSGAGPVRRPFDLADETGRGLHLVDHFSNGWGWLPRSTDGKVVWALFREPD